MNLVNEAIKGIREETVEYIVSRQVAYNEWCLNKLAEHDWDLNTAFPYPSSLSYRSRGEYVMQKNTHNFVQCRLTKQDKDRPYSYHINGPMYRVKDEENIKKLLDFTRHEANVDFDAYVIKLTKKIGLDTVESIVLDEKHRYLWDYSILHVTRKDGTKEVWKTMIITKTSKLGTVFNQWPTRKMKNV